MFSGLMSRWTTPFSCAYASAEAISHKWHREVRKTARFARRKQRDDMGVLELRCKLNFSAESVDADRRGHVGRKNLYDDFSSE